MTAERDLLKRALALILSGWDKHPLIDAIREHLAKPESDEPVAWIVQGCAFPFFNEDDAKQEAKLLKQKVHPYYSRPPRQQEDVKYAERYRFLRQLDAQGIQVYNCNNDASVYGDELDAAIDAAIAQEKSK